MHFTFSHNFCQLSSTCQLQVVAMMTPSQIAIELEAYLIRAGVAFDKNGFPIPDPEMVCHEIPVKVELHTIDRLCEARDLSRTIWRKLAMGQP